MFELVCLLGNFAAVDAEMQRYRYTGAERCTQLAQPHSWVCCVFNIYVSISKSMLLRSPLQQIFLSIFKYSQCVPFSEPFPGNCKPILTVV
jgi:hypothetical protein